ncbi:hypothetical protein [Enterococcus faecium]|uniref:hypothetical protein n=1 Tax=Enterococcus faecium TaxID=1352 RepID=UPI001650A5F8|nr:hypothetical protein [Enterococcus faecium]
MNEQTKEWSRKILNVASEKIDAELDRMGNKIPYISYVNFKFKLATHGDPVARYHQPSNFSNRVGP